MVAPDRTPYHDFQDRRQRLFGREADVRRLLGRCAEKGFTLVSGRPRMGKSWLIQETCRRLEEDLGSLEQHLSRLLGVNVDLVMKDSLKPRMGARILEEAVAV